MEFSKFDFERNRSIYSECQSERCPNLEISFLIEALKKRTVIIVTINKPSSMLLKAFGKNANLDKLFFIDAVSSLAGETVPQKNTIYLKPEEINLTQLQIIIENTWKSIKAPKLLFFDCGELLLTSFDTLQAIRFIQHMVQNFRNDGLVLFCFLKNVLTKTESMKLSHVFDDVIKI